MPKRLALARLMFLLVICSSVLSTGRVLGAPPVPQPKKITIASNRHLGVTALAFSPGGASLAAAGDTVVRLLRVQDGAVLRTFTDHPQPITCLAFSSDGRLLASGDEGGHVLLWDAISGQKRKAFRIDVGRFRDQPVRVRTLAFQPRHTLLAVGLGDDIGGEGRLEFWRLDTQRPRRIRVLDFYFGVEDLEYAPDGRNLAVALGYDDMEECRGAVAIIPIAGRQRTRLLRIVSPTLAVTFLSDGKHLACAGYFDSFVWDPAKGTSRIALEPGTEHISDISRSPDGKWLAGAREYDGGVHIWNAMTGKSQQILGAGGPTARSVAYSPNGDFLALGSEDGKVRLWKL